MQAFRDKVAVMTGGASGIGRAMVDRFAAEGMKMEDILEDRAPTTTSALRG